MTKEKKEEVIYVGSKKVANFKVADKTDLVGVLYEDNSSENYTTRQWESVKSDEKYDDGLVDTRKFTPLLKDILVLMLKENIRLIDKDFIINKLDASILENYSTMICKMFEVPEMSFISLGQIDANLKKLK